MKDLSAEFDQILREHWPKESPTRVVAAMREHDKREYKSHELQNKRCDKCNALTGTTVNDVAFCEGHITEFFYCLSKFKGEPLILIFAGTEQQFDAFKRYVRRTRIVTNMKAHYVRSPESLAGARGYIFVRYGTYFNRKDYEQVENYHKQNLLLSQHVDGSD